MGGLGVKNSIEAKPFRRKEGEGVKIVSASCFKTLFLNLNLQRMPRFNQINMYNHLVMACL